MSFILIPAGLASFQQRIAPVGGTYLQCVQSPGDGLYLESQAAGAGQSALSFFLFGDAQFMPPIDPADTINFVTLRLIAKNKTAGQASDILTIVANVTVGTFTLSDAYDTYDTVMPLHPSVGTPFPWAPGNITSNAYGFAVLGGNFNCDVDFLGILIDYTPLVPPPSDSQAVVWCSGPYPARCGQPPLTAFKPLGVYKFVDGDVQDVSDIILQRYGIPIAGYVIWTYFRSITDEPYPSSPSPLTFHTVT